MSASDRVNLEQSMTIRSTARGWMTRTPSVAEAHVICSLTPKRW